VNKKVFASNKHVKNEGGQNREGTSTARYCYTNVDNIMPSLYVPERKLQDKKLEEAEAYLMRYGLRTVDAVVIGNEFILQALALIGRVIQKFPKGFVKDF